MCRPSTWRPCPRGTGTSRQPSTPHAKRRSAITMVHVPGGASSPRTAAPMADSAITQRRRRWTRGLIALRAIRKVGRPLRCLAPPPTHKRARRPIHPRRCRCAERWVHHLLRREAPNDRGLPRRRCDEQPLVLVRARCDPGDSLSLEADSTHAHCSVLRVHQSCCCSCLFFTCCYHILIR